MITPYKLLLNGEWIDSQSRDYFEDFNPATGKRFAKIALGGSQDGSHAVEVAYQSIPFWSDLRLNRQKDILLKAAEILESEKNQFFWILTSESGATKIRARYEFEKSIQLIRRAAEFTVNSEIESTGINLIFCHWHFPLYFTVKAIVDSILNRTSMVINPSVETPVIGLLLGKTFLSAGLPSNMLNVITGPSDLFDSVLINDNRIQCLTAMNEIPEISSLPVSVLHQGEKMVKHVKLSSSAVIVLDDTSIEPAVGFIKKLFFEKIENCWGASGYLLIDESVSKKFVKCLKETAKGLKIGDPSSEFNSIGPLISEQQVQKIHSQVNEAIIKGASIQSGGSYSGCFYKPTIITDVVPSMKIFKDQAIGPIIPIVTLKNKKESFAHIIEQEKPGFVHVFSKNKERAKKIIEKINFSSVSMQNNQLHEFTFSTSQCLGDNWISDQAISELKSSDFIKGNNKSKQRIWGA